MPFAFLVGPVVGTGETHSLPGDHTDFIQMMNDGDAVEKQKYQTCTSIGLVNEIVYIKK